MTRPPFVDMPRNRPADIEFGRGSRTWSVRGRNVAVTITDLVGGDRLDERRVPDEYVVLVTDDIAVTVEHRDAGVVAITGPALVIVPAGESSVRAAASTTVTRVFSSRHAAVLGHAVNRGDAIDPGVAPLPEAAPTGSGRLDVHALDDAPAVDGRFGRILRTGSLMINWFPPQVGPRDTDALSPHSHDDFEQVSVTLEGDYAHHFRTPWTSRMSEWREDQHVEVSSPSLALIPPRVVHTTGAVGPGHHTLVDVFAPPRADFLARGWVLNADDYRDGGAS